MDLNELKQKYIKETLGIGDSFGVISSFIDFANVNNWFEDDRFSFDGRALSNNEKNVIDLEKLKSFASASFAEVRFYYGHDPENPKSLGFTRAARDIFGKRRVFTKPIQKIRHHLTQEEVQSNNRKICTDKDGFYIRIPKCNFDVEICVDAIKLSENYDTFCIFSGDADFVHLARFLKGKGKKIIIIKGGHIHHTLKDIADRIINAQDIKTDIVKIKAKT